MGVESEAEGRVEMSAIDVRLLGPLAILRDGRAVALPPSRKVRALFGYLALSPQAAMRRHLCELLWDVPDDPRGELRWSLSKIRGLFDDDDKWRVVTEGEAVRLDLSGCRVDALEVARAFPPGGRGLEAGRAKALERLFAGDLLEGLEAERYPSFDTWLTAQRRRFRSWHIMLLEQIVREDPEASRDCIDTWLKLAPFDLKAHGLLLDALARAGQMREAEEHVAAACRLFEAEGFDTGPVQAAWQAARSRQEGGPPATAGDSAPAPRDASGTQGEGAAAAGARRASVAVMPFHDRTSDFAPAQRLGEALAHDVITRLSKLRSLFVIAQGSVLRLHERHIGAGQAGRMLNVAYVVSGWLRRHAGNLTIAVELSHTETGQIVWAETFDRPVGDTFRVLEDIGNVIVASVCSEIEAAERNRAILKPPNGLDAWEAYHRGLWHMYRFNADDNASARHFFEVATGLDPTFARAHAGVSFAHFQNAFQGWAPRQAEIDRALDAAQRSLMVDERDPAAHWAMGRALWLKGQHDPAVAELGQAIELSPNFAQGHYALAFVQSQAGDPAAAIAASDHSRQLSPFDPMLFGMLGARAMALVRLGAFEAAAEWGVKAAARPNAHAHIHAIAALSLGLAGRHAEAVDHLAAILKVKPRYGIADFLTAMQFSPDTQALYRDSARRIGMA